MGGQLRPGPVWQDRSSHCVKLQMKLSYSGGLGTLERTAIKESCSCRMELS